MLFMRQIKFEIRNILKSRFLLIMAILVIVAAVAIPVIGYFSNSGNGGGIIEPTYYPVRDVAYVNSAGNYKGDYYEGPKGEAITVNGVTIEVDNPFYWQLSSLLQEKVYYESNQIPLNYPETQDLLLELIAAEISYNLRFAQAVTRSQDYRVDLAWRGTESLSDLFFYGQNDVQEEVLLEASYYRKGMDPEAFKAKFINITAAERLAGLAKADEYLAMIYAIVDNDDFPKYIDFRLGMENDQIIELKANIAIQEQAIIENPTQEESLNQIIESLKKQIELIETNNIPLLNYRLEKNIRPGEAIWQNAALSEIENSRNQLVYLVIMSEEEWNQNARPEGKFDYYYGNGSQTYQEYVAAMQRQIDQLNKTIIIAQKSLDANQPDMKYVPEGARNRTVQFLEYSIIVALFGVLLGGWLIASEFQQGTIRLLMIRPKTRTKILLAKFFAALLVCLAVDLAGSLLNMLSNGVLFGFGDFANPIFSVAGQTSFFIYFVPRFLACLLPILFAFTLSFMFSVVARNIAVSIAVPIIFLIGSIIMMGILGYSNSMTWLAYTPIPFIQISAFFQRYSSVQNLIQNGVKISLAYGIALLLALSAVFTLVSLVVFKKRDIAN